MIEKPNQTADGENSAKIEHAKRIAARRDDELVSLLVEILDDEREKRIEAERREDELRDRVADLENELQAVDGKAEGAARRSDMNVERVTELQSREIEKGAHLLAEHVDRDRIYTTDGQIEAITKEDGERYFRAPGAEDGLQIGGGVMHSTADLLPLQRLSRYDDEMLASVAKTKPDKIAAKAWRQRDETGRYGLWSKGSGEIRVYLRSSSLAEEIRTTHSGISKSYSQELARRAFESMIDLSKGRLVKKKENHEVDGLRHEELQIELRSNVELPGESIPSAVDDVPATDEVAGAD